jgi:hypothetical protein
MAFDEFADDYDRAYREETRANLPQRPYPSSETGSSRPVAALPLAIPDLTALRGCLPERAEWYGTGRQLADLTGFLNP